MTVYLIVVNTCVAIAAHTWYGECISTRIAITSASIDAAAEGECLGESRVRSQPSQQCQPSQQLNGDNAMAGDTIITIIGNLTADPELRFTPSGAAVASFTVASTPRTFDRQAGEWKDGETLFMPCQAWRQMAETVAESLTKGTRVIVQGRLVQRSYTTREGENRTVVEMQVDEIGPSLRYAKAQVTRQPRGGGQGQSGYNAPAGGAADDPWATGGSTSFGDEPPF